MPKAQAYVIEQLKRAGLEPRPCGHGVVAEREEGRQDAAAARGYGRAADEGGERRAFACPTGTEAHACAMIFTRRCCCRRQSCSRSRRRNLRAGSAYVPARGGDFRGREGYDRKRHSGRRGRGDCLSRQHRPYAGRHLYVQRQRHNDELGRRLSDHRIRQGLARRVPAELDRPDQHRVHIYLALEALLAREPTQQDLCDDRRTVHCRAAANIIPIPPFCRARSARMTATAARCWCAA